jgi:membrane-associated phospholipid phosphatase
MFQKYKHFSALIIFVFLTAWFEYLKVTIVAKHEMYAKLDSEIPFVKQFVLAYYTWFIYMAVGFAILGIVSKMDFYKMLTFLSLGMVISFIIFIIYPNEQFPRPIVRGNDIFSILVRFIYNHDKTNDVFPSIHVCNAIGVFVSLYNCEKLKSKKIFQLISFIICILICASTLFIKQHSVIDVAGGMVLAAVIYIAIYKLPKFIKKEDTSINLDV